MKNLPMVPALTMVALAAFAPAANANFQRVAEIADLDLEQLTRIKVTSASRMRAAPAAHSARPRVSAKHRKSPFVTTARVRPSHS